jgi:hypothetical protein
MWRVCFWDAAAAFRMLSRVWQTSGVTSSHCCVYARLLYCYPSGKSSDGNNYEWAIVSGGPPRTSTKDGCVVGPLNPGPRDVNESGALLPLLLPLPLLPPLQVALGMLCFCPLPCSCSCNLVGLAHCRALPSRRLKWDTRQQHLASLLLLLCDLQVCDCSCANLLALPMCNPSDCDSSML